MKIVGMFLNLSALPPDRYLNFQEKGLTFQRSNTGAIIKYTHTSHVRSRVQLLGKN